MERLTGEDRREQQPKGAVYFTDDAGLTIVGPAGVLGRQISRYAERVLNVLLLDACHLLDESAEFVPGHARADRPNAVPAAASLRRPLPPDLAGATL
jgi:hypothetical protein